MIFEIIPIKHAIQFRVTLDMVVVQYRMMKAKNEKNRLQHRSLIYRMLSKLTGTPRA